MADLQTLRGYRDELQRARFTGQRRVRDASGEEVEFRSDRELASAIAALDSEIMTLGGRKPSTILFKTNKGV